MVITIGVGWSTEFDRGGLRKLQYRRLRLAYRAPSYFLQGMLAAGCQVRFLNFDEDLTESDLDAPSAAATSVDILYIASHGMTSPTGYRCVLHGADWPLLSAQHFGVHGPAVVIFDTCDLVDPARQGWVAEWQSAQIGPALRLILGFRSLATVGQKSSLRGRAFAEELKCRPIAEAWWAAIQGTRYIGTDKPLALAFGDDVDDAISVLTTMRVDAIAGPRAAVLPEVAWGPA